VVSEQGKTVDLYVKPYTGLNLEDVIGKAATSNDISDNMDLGKSMRNLLIGILLGCGIGAFILGPLIQSIMK
jgi:hypothetical protein